MRRLLFSLAILLSLALWSRAADGAPQLHLLCWSEYVPQSVIDRFREAAGAEVQVENYDSNEQMLEKLRGRPEFYDVVQPSGFYVKMLADAEQLEPLDPARLPNLADLDPEFQRLPFDPEGRFSVPWLSGTVGIVVNTGKIADPIREWGDVFTGKYAGRIVVVDDAREMVAWALASQDLPITDVSDDTLARIAPVLGRWLPQVAVFDSAAPAAPLRDGRADIGIIWSGEAAALLRENPKYRFVLPARGAHRFVDCLAIPKGAPNRELALRFVNHCLDPQVSLLISRAYPYTNPNLAARKLLTEEERSNPASYPACAATLPMLRNDGNDSAAVAAFVRRIRERIAPAAK